ncbi:MAG: hypothetical protein QXZ09_05320, partial [Candidatus Methanomethylicaceae archaeon]
MLSYFQIYWAILPWTDELDINSETKTSHEKAIQDYRFLVSLSNDNELLEIVKFLTENPAYKTTTKLGSVYSLLLVLVEKLLAARKSFRNPIKNLFYKSNGCKCTLCGEFNAIIKIQDLCKENRNYRSLINLI